MSFDLIVFYAVPGAKTMPLFLGSIKMFSPRFVDVLKPSYIKDPDTGGKPELLIVCFLMKLNVAILSLLFII